MAFVCFLLGMYLVALFARVVLSWFPLAEGSVMAQVYSALWNITEPVLGPLRRMLPPVQMGAAALDLSPLVIFFGIQLLRRAIC